MSRYLIQLLIVLAVSGCATTPPTNQDDICKIFYEKDDWFDDVEDAESRWGVPIQIIMAFIHQESRQIKIKSGDAMQFVLVSLTKWQKRLNA